jgi:hypothetical protein
LDLRPAQASAFPELLDLDQQTTDVRGGFATAINDGHIGRVIANGLDLSHGMHLGQ